MLRGCENDRVYDGLLYWNSQYQMIQQQVEQLPFEHILISKLEHKAKRTNKIRDWLTLLKAYQQNNFLHQKDKTIETMHYKFILNEQFWLQELDTRMIEDGIKITERDIDILMLAIQDGIYLNFLSKLVAFFIAELAKSRFRTNYLISRIQRIINTVKRQKNFYPELRKYYKSANNIKKTRELYLRELRTGFDTHDILYDEYTLWETELNYLASAEEAYEKGKKQWEEHASNKVDHLNHPQANFDSVNYLRLVQQLKTDAEKLRYLRISCLGRHQLVNQYFQLLEYIHRNDQDLVMLSYEHVLDIVPQIQMSYLRFLVRRINKHVSQTQTETYNTAWPSKVQYFRTQISTLIQKPRLTPKIHESIKQLYYNFWLQIQTSLIKDKASICQLFEAALQIRNSVQIYSKYCNAMIKLNAYGDAKNVVKRCCQMHKFQYQAYKLYENFIAVYGDIEDVLEMRKIEAKGKEKIRGLDENKDKGKKQVKQEELQEREKEKKDNGVKRIIIEVNGASNFGRNDNKKDEQLEKVPIKQKYKKEQKKYKNGQKQTKNQKAEKQKQNSQKITSDKKQSENTIKELQVAPKRRKVLNITEEESSLRKRKGNENYAEETPEQQLSSPISQEPKKKAHLDLGNTLFIKGFSTDYREQDIRKLLKNQDKIKQIRLVEKKGVYQNYCYVEMSSPEVADQQVSQNTHKDITIAISKPPAAYSQDQTLFAAGLPLTATPQKMKEIFGEHSENIADVRLKLDENRHIAYIDFKSAESAQKALQSLSHKNLTIDQKKIFLKQSHSRPQQKRKEYKVVVLKHLSFKAKNRDIAEYYKDFTIQDIYIPQNQQGKSKGFAFIEFKKEEDVKKVLEMGGGEIKGRRFEVQRSERQIQRPKVEQKSKKQVDNNFFNNLFK